MAQSHRTLVTGATGFVGGHLVRRLKAAGWDVHVLVRSGSNARNLHELLGESNVHPFDGTSARLSAIVARAEPEIVFHLASLFLSQHAPGDVENLVRSNIEFPVQLAEAMTSHGVRHLVNTGTAWQHFEDADFNPVNLYAATKQACVDLLRYYTEAGSLNVINLELYDTYGPRDPRPKLFSLLRKAAESSAQLPMSPGEQELELVYIDDVTSAFVAAAERVTTANATMATYAVRTGQPKKLREIVETWQRVTGKTLRIDWGKRPYRPREMMTPPTLVPTLPGWQAQIPLEEGLRQMESAL